MLIKMATVYLLLIVFAFANGSEVNMLQQFVKFIKDHWQLLSPTVIFEDEIPEVCRNLNLGLCLTASMDMNELTQHLTTIHQGRKQDSIVFLGEHGHKDVIKKIANHVPSLFTSNIPVFMSSVYTNYISLRLDSNIVFYEKDAYLPGTYKLVDKFAVKGGSMIVLPLGFWNAEDGVILTESINRWDRRTDLRGSHFRNCLFSNGDLADFTRDEHGNITGTNGYYQDMLFYVTEKLNLSVVSVESTDIINDPCGGPGKKFDVASSGYGIDPQGCSYAEFTLPIFREPITLIAAKPKGTAPNMWVYARVFGIYPWILFIVLLTLLGVAMSIQRTLIEDDLDWKSGTNERVNKNPDLFARFALVYLYAIQMGYHPRSKLLTSRILTLTTSFLTFVIFTHYATDITSEMTSGPPDIPIRTYEDVIHHDFKVIAYAGHLRDMLRDAGPDTAKNKVFESSRLIELNDQTPNAYLDASIEAMNEVVRDPKTLLLTISNINMLKSYSNNEEYKQLMDQMLALKMDDSWFQINTFWLAKNSEFLHIFDHYLLKEMESGFLKRLFQKRWASIEENFEMREPQSLGFSNVLFCFIFLGFGILLSIVCATIELIKNKLWQLGFLRKRNRTDESLHVQNRRERTQQWVTREIKFDDENRLNVDSRNDEDVETWRFRRQKRSSTWPKINVCKT